MTGTKIEHSRHPHHHQQQQIDHPHPPHHHTHHSMRREPSGEHDRDVHGLRLALGSILSPKRLSTPSSHASSGTASPCPSHFGPGLSHSYHHGPSHLHTPPDKNDEPEGAKSAAESPAANGSTPSVIPPGPNSTLSGENSSSVIPLDKSHSQPDSQEHKPVPQILTTSNVHALSDSQAQSIKEGKDRDENDRTALKYGALKEKLERERKDGKENASGRGLEAYIATLQSKRAWDALVHGNMS